MNEGVIGGFSSKDVEYIFRTVNEAYDQYKMAESELDYCDKKTQDILHELELVEHTYHEKARLGVELSDIRKRRRIAKDAIDVLSPIVKWRDEEFLAGKALSRLQKVLGDIRKVEEKQKNAIYYYRADNAGTMIVG